MCKKCLHSIQYWAAYRFVERGRLEMNPQDHPAIWISEPSLFSDWTTKRFPTDPDAMPLPVLKGDDDGALWVDFSSRMNEKVTQLNKHFGPILICWLFLLALFLFATGSQRVEGPILMAIIPAAILVIVGLASITKKNKRLDMEIAMIVESYQNRFVEQYGIQLDYKTLYTGFCKPKHARAMRALIFKPVVEQVT